jgi:hypothetical protein
MIVRPTARTSPEFAKSPLHFYSFIPAAATLPLAKWEVVQAGVST